MKKIFTLLVMSIFLLSFMSVGVLAQNSNPNPKTINVCMKDAVKQKNTDFKVAKATYAVALSQANLIQDLGDKKAARDQARSDFKAAIKGIKTAFQTARKACLA